jgi:hypothetical protein
MSGRLNTTGIEEQGNYKLPPKGEYNVEIIKVMPKTTENRDPMISTKFSIAGGEYQGVTLWDNIILSEDPDSPGYAILGKTKHFLHCLNEEYEGEFSWNENNWLGKITKIKLGHEEPNKYHPDYTKAIVTQYVLDEAMQKETIADLTSPDF